MALQTEGAVSREPRRSTTPGAGSAPVADADVENVANAILTSLDDSKAEEIVKIDIRGKSSLGDYMVVASGRSHRHVGAIAEHLLQHLREIGVRNIRVDGLPHCDWVLVDAGDVLVHIFRPEVRGFYNLEKMWQADPVAAPVAARG